MNTHTTLYLKYRPQHFDELEGQEHIRTTLKNASRLDVLSHAYLFCGPRGTGKTSSARITAKALCCENKLPDGNPCGICELCTEIADGTLTDIIEIDAASHRGIDDIRMMRERIRFAPNKARKKVYVIDEVHMLTKDASNALLKTLEEPPAHVHFILATTEYQKLLPTIVSRCQVFQFLPFTEQELRQRLSYVLEKERVTISEEALLPIIQHSQGGMRDALSLLEKVLHSGYESFTPERILQLLGKDDDLQWQELLQALKDQNSTQINTILTSCWERGRSGEHVLKSFLTFLRKELRIAIQRQNKTDTAFLLRLISHGELFSQQIRTSLVPELLCETTLLSFFISPTAPTPTPLVMKQEPTPMATQVLVEDVGTTAEIKVTKRPLGASHPAQEQHEQIIVAEPIPTPAEKLSVPQPKSHHEDTPLTMTAIRKEWEHFAQSIPGTIVRLTVKDHLRPLEMKEGQLLLSCQSEFHKNIIAKPEHQKLIQEQFTTYFDVPLILIFPGASVTTLAPNPKPQAKKETLTKEANTPPATEVDIDKIADFFGGSVLS